MLHTAHPTVVCFPTGCMDAAESGRCSGGHQLGRRLLPHHLQGVRGGGSRDHMPHCTVLWCSCLHGVSSQNGQMGERHTIVMAGDAHTAHHFNDALVSMSYPMVATLNMGLMMQARPHVPPGKAV